MSRAPMYIGRCRTTPRVVASVPNQNATGCGNAIPPKDEKILRCRVPILGPSRVAGGFDYRLWRADGKAKAGGGVTPAKCRAGAARPALRPPPFAHRARPFRPAAPHAPAAHRAN